MLRKKFYVVRKKNHVVRKIFYVASIFCGAAGRKNRPPWEKVTQPWELSSTASRLTFPDKPRGAAFNAFFLDKSIFSGRLEKCSGR